MASDSVKDILARARKNYTGLGAASTEPASPERAAATTGGQVQPPRPSAPPPSGGSLIERGPGSKADTTARRAATKVGEPIGPGPIAVPVPEDNDASLSGLDLVKRFIELDEIAKALKDLADPINERIGAMRTRIAEFFAEEGMENMRIGGFTVYIRRELWVSYRKPDTEGMTKEEAAAVTAAAKADLVERLKRAEWDVPDPDDPTRVRHISTAHLVKEDYSAMSLAGLFRELPIDEQGTPIMPPELAEAVQVYYDIKPCKRRSK